MARYMERLMDGWVGIWVGGWMFFFLKVYRAELQVCRRVVAQTYCWGVRRVVDLNPGRFAPKPFPPLVVSPPRRFPPGRFPPGRFAPTSRFAPLVVSPLVYIRSSVVSNLGLNCLQNSPRILKACKFMFCYLSTDHSRS